MDGQTYNLSTVTHLVYLYLVLGQYIHSVEIPMSTSPQLTPGFTYREFTTYNAAFIDLEVNLIKIQISYKGTQHRELCAYVEICILIRWSRSYLSYQTDPFEMMCPPL